MCIRDSVSPAASVGGAAGTSALPEVWFDASSEVETGDVSAGVERTEEPGELAVVDRVEAPGEVDGTDGAATGEEKLTPAPRRESNATLVMTRSKVADFLRSVLGLPGSSVLHAAEERRLHKADIAFIPDPMPPDNKLIACACY